MITNTHRGDFYSVPLFRLEKASHTVAWIKRKAGRELLRTTLHRMFPEGCGVCADTCQLMAYINPRGGVRDVPFPWPSYPIWQMVNNPRPEEGSENECPCLDFLDPEAGTWRARGLNRHHPFCMFDPAASKRYQHFVDLKKVPDRPDAWFKSLKEIR